MTILETLAIAMGMTVWGTVIVVMVIQLFKLTES